LVALTVLFLAARKIARSKIGSELRTIDIESGGSEMAAETLGVNIGKIKTQVLVISAAYAGIGGSLYVHYITHIDPGPYSLWISFMLVVMVVIGGSKSLWGPILGATFYIGLKELISYLVPSGASVIIVGCETIVFSLVFITIVLLFPDGLVGLMHPLRALFQRWADPANRTVTK
jgi:branched-chain amino acid transport system permease protein